MNITIIIIKINVNNNWKIRYVKKLKLVTKKQ